jgi:hypothetical protein
MNSGNEKSRKHVEKYHRNTKKRIKKQLKQE